MIYALIALVITIIIVLIASGGSIDGIVVQLGIFMYIIAIALVCLIGREIGWSDPEYQNVSSTYDIKEMQENKYYIASSDGDSVSVLIDKGYGFEKETFPEDVVTFVETTDSAKVDMDLKVFKNPTKEDAILFNKPSEPNEEFPEKIYESVTIYVPEESKAESQTLEIKGDDQKAVGNKAYCSVCGAEIGDGANFCSGCGEKLN